MFSYVHMTRLWLKEFECSKELTKIFSIMLLGEAQNLNMQVSQCFSSYAQCNIFQDSYTYSYKINHPPKETYIAKTESREGKLVQGQYSYVDTEGSLVTVQYEADEDGFRETRNLQPNFLKTYSGDLESLFGPVIPAEPAPRAVVYNEPAPKPIEAPKTFVYNKPAPKPVVYAKPAPKPVLAFKPAPPPAPKSATNNKDLVARIISQLTPFIKDTVLEGVSDEDLRRKSSFLTY